MHSWVDLAQVGLQAALFRLQIVDAVADFGLTLVFRLLVDVHIVVRRVQISVELPNLAANLVQARPYLIDLGRLVGLPDGIARLGRQGLGRNVFGILFADSHYSGLCSVLTIRHHRHAATSSKGLPT